MEQFTVVGLCDCQMKVKWLSDVEVLKCGGVGWGVVGVWGCGMGGCGVWGCGMGGCGVWGCRGVGV